MKTVSNTGGGAGARSTMTAATTPAWPPLATLRAAERREDHLLAEHSRTRMLLDTIYALAARPETGAPGQEIVRLIAEHGRAVASEAVQP